MPHHSRNAKKYYTKNAKGAAGPKGPNKGVPKGSTNKSGHKAEQDTAAKPKGVKPKSAKKVKTTVKAKSKRKTKSH